LKSLFLHWGPGCNAEIERRWFGNQTLIDFWNQPKVSAPGSFNQIVEAALDRLDELFEQSNKPQHLLAHSFGGRLAYELARLSPQKIQGITLLGSTFDPWMSYLRFAEFLSRFNPTLSELSKKADQTRTPEDLFGMFQLCAQIPDFHKYYWSNPEAMAQYNKLANGVDLIDMDMLVSTLGEFVGTPKQPQPVALLKNTPVRLFVGEGDPMANAEEDAKTWSRAFMNCELTVVPHAGHFVHFEAEPSVWLGSLTSSFRLER
jgi:pimeloyl-ACP methyl ester carboxylesterase